MPSLGHASPQIELKLRDTGASDATYHVMWIILFNAVDDFGIREINDLVRNGHPAEMFPDYRLVQASKQKLMDEALHGALRISGLVS